MPHALHVCSSRSRNAAEAKGLSLFFLLRSPAKPLALLQKYRKYKQEVSPAPVNTWHGLQQLEPRLLLNADPTGPVATAGPYIVDQVLTANNTLADEDGLGVISYQWNRDNIPIAGATESTYVLSQDDAGTEITVTASYTDGLVQTKALRHKR